jgi:hypothetical protein
MFVSPARTFLPDADLSTGQIFLLSLTLLKLQQHMNPSCMLSFAICCHSHVCTPPLHATPCPAARSRQPAVPEGRGSLMGRWHPLLHRWAQAVLNTTAVPHSFGILWDAQHSHAHSAVPCVCFAVTTDRAQQHPSCLHVHAPCVPILDVLCLKLVLTLYRSTPPELHFYSLHISTA